MRGRKPCSLSIAAKDRPILEHVARSDSLPWYQVRRARIVLALAAGERTQTIAWQMQCDAATVWRTAQRYRHAGLAGLLDNPWHGQCGRLARISPPAESAAHPTGLPGAHRQGAAHHPLVQCRPGAPSRGRWHRGSHQRPQRPPHLAGGRSATASHPLLEDRPAGCPVHGARRKDPVGIRSYPELGGQRDERRCW